MKALILNAFGGPENFHLADVPVPPVDPGTVLIRAAAASLNPADISIRKGTPFSPALPAILGADIAGIVEAVGEGVRAFAPGDEVYGCIGGVRGTGGTLAKYAVADARLLAHKPRSLSMREAAALPLVAITAWEGIHRTGVTSADHVLVHAGTGGVGHVAVQMAAAIGARVSTTVSAGAATTALRIGATATIDYRSECIEAYVERLTHNAGFDVVFDTIGNAHLAESFRASRHNGRIATTMALANVDLVQMHMKGLSLHVIFMLLPMLTGEGRERHGAILREVAKLADEGSLRPLVDESRFTLATAMEGYRRLEAGDAFGKIVIDIESAIS